MQLRVTRSHDVERKSVKYSYTIQLVATDAEVQQLRTYVEPNDPRGLLRQLLSGIADSANDVNHANNMIDIWISNAREFQRIARLGASFGGSSVIDLSQDEEPPSPTQ